MVIRLSTDLFDKCYMLGIPSPDVEGNNICMFQEVITQLIYRTSVQIVLQLKNINIIFIVDTYYSIFRILNFDFATLSKILSCWKPFNILAYILIAFLSIMLFFELWHFLSGKVRYAQAGSVVMMRLKTCELSPLCTPTTAKTIASFFSFTVYWHNEINFIKCLLLTVHSPYVLR